MTDQNKEAISVLNDLIETSKDGQEGFKSCAEDIKHPELKALFVKRSADCATAAAELQAQVRATASISALVKFKVMGSPRLTGLPWLAVTVCCANAFIGNRVLAPVNIEQVTIEIIAFLRCLKMSVCMCGGLTLAHGDDGARAIAAPQNVQKIRQCLDPVGRCAGHAVEAQSPASPLALAAEL